MHIKWAFHYGKDEYAVSDVFTEEDDQNIAKAINSGANLICIAGATRNLYVNMNQVKLIQREIVDEKAEKFEKVTENKMPPEVN